MRVLSVMLAAAGWAVVVAVTTLGQPRDGTPTADPCALVTTSEVEQLVGKLKGTPKSDRHDRAKVCVFEFVSDTHGFEIWLFPATGLERAKSAKKPLTPVTDLGVEAYLHRDTSIEYLDLYTKKGEVTLQISMKSPPGTEAAVKALARSALRRL